MDKSRIYFKNLNALRFFAATAVIFHHVEQHKYWAKLPNIWGNTAIDAFGNEAVAFFFVLSGFLITYLLLEENKQKRSIDIQNFYIRRVLRIMPLYYLIVLVCIVFLPYFHETLNLGDDYFVNNYWLVSILLLLVLPNLVRALTTHIVGGTQLWSIGVEEQFYFVWPLFVNKFVKNFLVFLIVFIAMKIAVTWALEILNAAYESMILKKALQVWVLLQVEQMAIGAIGAWILFTGNEKVLSIIYRPIVFYINCLLGVLLFIIPVEHWWINYAEAAIFIVFIMNLSTSPRINVSLENKTLNVFGNISYGIYMYHTLCIGFCLFVLRYFEVHKTNVVFFNILLYSSSVLLTLAVAYGSYEMFEKRFLELKEKFMVVKSGGESSRKQKAES
jgi:peptidoglycan/LPS O-acetylase OafA/YrhL